MRKHTRIFAAIMTLIEALVLTSFTGCAGKKVDYGNESESKETKNMSALADIRQTPAGMKTLPYRPVMARKQYMYMQIL